MGAIFPIGPVSLKVFLAIKAWVIFLAVRCRWMQLAASPD